MPFRGGRPKPTGPPGPPASQRPPATEPGPVVPDHLLEHQSPLSPAVDAWSPAPPIGSVAVAVAVGIVAVLAGSVLWRAPAADTSTLTMSGAHFVMPERDVLVYLAGGALSVALAHLFCARSGPGHLPPSVQVAVAAGSTGAVVTAFLRYRGSDGRGPLATVAVVLTLACVAAGWLGASPRQRAPSHPEPTPETGRPRLRWRAGDLIVGLAVVAVVYVPDWRQIAGGAFDGEEFLHLDFFAMGPALAFQHGAALGTDVHPYYGLGWPLAFAALGRVATLSYGAVVLTGVLYGCIYFAALYLLLRVLVRARLWALAGTMLAVLFQLFAGFSAALVLWRYPSATVMRYAFDVWVLIAGLLYLRTGKSSWARLGGGLVGLAVLFQTDTGAYVAVAFAFVLVAGWQMSTDRRRELVTCLGSAAIGAAVLLAGVSISSRGTAFSHLGFWTGWLENLWLSMAGATLLPLSGTPDRWTIVVFVAMVATYLLVVSSAVVRLASRRLTPDTAFLGAVAAYGLLTMLYFVGRSHPYNLFRTAIPFAVLLTGYGALAGVAATSRSGSVRRRWSRPAKVASRAMPPVAAAVAVALLVAHPGFDRYPGLTRTIVKGGTPDGMCLSPPAQDVCGIPEWRVAYASDLATVAAQLRAAPQPRATVAVLDGMGPLLHLMAGSRPWGRYQPVFPSMFTIDQVETVVAELERHPPDLVVMRSPAARIPFYDDIWQRFRGPVERGFVLTSTSGPFEIWSRNPDERQPPGTTG